MIRLGLVVSLPVLAVIFGAFMAEFEPMVEAWRESLQPHWILPSLILYWLVVGLFVAILTALPRILILKYYDLKNANKGHAIINVFGIVNAFYATILVVFSAVDYVAFIGNSGEIITSSGTHLSWACYAIVSIIYLVNRIDGGKKSA